MRDWSEALRDLLEQREASRQRFRALEDECLARRQRNHERLMRHRQRNGPRASGPRLIEPPAAWSARNIAVRAQLDVVNLCLPGTGLPDPYWMRAMLKAARNRVDDPELYETQLKAYLRAKNRAIGWQQVWLDGYIGPDPAPVAEWGRNAEVPQGEAYQEILERCDLYGERIVLAGSPPPEPEFREERRRELLEQVRVNQLRRHLCQEFSRKMGTKPANLVEAVDWLAWKYVLAALRQMRSSRLEALINVLGRMAGEPERGETVFDSKRYAREWFRLCRRLHNIVSSDAAKAFVSGECGIGDVIKGGL